jgi:competence protein ComEC
VKRIAPWWNIFPFVRILIPFIAGIYFQTAYPPVVIGIIAAIGSITAALLRMSSIYMQFRLRSVTGLSFNAILFAFGSFAAFIHDIRNSPQWFANHPYEQLLAVTISEPRLGETGYYIDASIVKRRQKNNWHNTSGIVRLRITGNNKMLFPGSVLRFTRSPKPVKNLPGSAFDYRSYLANRNIYHQLSLSITDVEIPHAETEPRGTISHMRNNILSILDEAFPVSPERALAKALLVGERAELDKTLVQAYSDTGVIHVIAISGLHLGLIYGMLIMVLRPFTRKRNGKLLVNASIAIALWIFTLICGASPSVVRSAVMFTSLLVGDSIGSENNTGNALASSAFLLLCYDPFLIRDVGFQLSYAAVASLLLYNRSVASFYHPENSLLANVWSSISTSISAQILTTPLILVHFHQFPIVFILSNLVAVPVSGLILLLLILLCLLQVVPISGMMIIKASSFLIGLMNHQVTRLASLPFSAWKNIECTTQDLFFMYLSILFLTLYAKTRSPKGLIFFLLTILTWLVSGKYSLP